MRWRLASWLSGLVVAVLGCQEGAGAGPGDDPCGGACGRDAVCDEATATCYCGAGTWGDPLAACVPHDDACAEAEARVGHSVCEHELHDETTWTLLSIGHSVNAGVRRGAKYLVPAGPRARLPPVLGDTNWYRFHYCLMARGFEPLFPAATYDDYLELVIERDTQELLGGTISELEDDGSGMPRFSFTIETRPEASAQLSLAEIHGVYLQLRDRFTLGTLAYSPDSPLQAETLAGLGEPPFPVVLEQEGADDLAYEAYTTGLAYGRVLLLTRAEIDDGGPLPFGWQDVVVVDEPPETLGGVMAAAVTETRQDVLTHLNVLSSLRGTPNVHVADAREVFAPYEGQLVRIEVLPTYYSIRPASLEEAQAHWASTRPRVTPGAPPDFEFAEILDLDDVAVGEPEARRLAVSRFGSKAAGLAVLRAVAPGDQVVRGMGIPMAAYRGFMEGNAWEAPVAEGTAMLTYAETIERWLDDEAFRTDPALRSVRLPALQREMEAHGVVDPALLDAIRLAVGEAFGGEDVMVRFRSSSNAEDSLEFNGAGLYASASGCPLDTDPSAGASLCNDDEAKPVDAALKKVWASLWGVAAFEEREYYQMDHRQVGMGVLVNPRFQDEAANGVAFTGNPSDLADPRFTINVQVGEVPVVDATPGVVAELDRVRLEGGQVVAIDREIPSSLVPAGHHVLDDAQVTALAELLSQVAADYPVDGTPPPGTRVMLDTEFKLTTEGLVLKQIRPFAARPYVPGGDQCR